MIALELLTWIAAGLTLAALTVALSGPPWLKWGRSLGYGALGGVVGGVLGRLLEAPTLEIHGIRLLSLIASAAGAGVALVAEWNLQRDADLANVQPPGVTVPVVGKKPVT